MVRWSPDTYNKHSLEEVEEENGDTENNSEEQSDYDIGNIKLNVDEKLENLSKGKFVIAENVSQRFEKKRCKFDENSGNIGDCKNLKGAISRNKSGNLTIINEVENTNANQFSQIGSQRFMNPVTKKYFVPKERTLPRRPSDLLSQPKKMFNMSFKSMNNSTDQSDEEDSLNSDDDAPQPSATNCDQVKSGVFVTTLNSASLAADNIKLKSFKDYCYSKSEIQLCKDNSLKLVDAFNERASISSPMPFVHVDHLNETVQVSTVTINDTICTVVPRTAIDRNDNRLTTVAVCKTTDSLTSQKAVMVVTASQPSDVKSKDKVVTQRISSFWPALLNNATAAILAMSCENLESLITNKYAAEIMPFSHSNPNKACACPSTQSSGMVDDSNIFKFKTGSTSSAESIVAVAARLEEKNDDAKEGIKNKQFPSSFNRAFSVDGQMPTFLRTKPSTIACLNQKRKSDFLAGPTTSAMSKVSLGFPIIRKDSPAGTKVRRSLSLSERGDVVCVRDISVERPQDIHDDVHFNQNTSVNQAFSTHVGSSPLSEPNANLALSQHRAITALRDHVRRTDALEAALNYSTARLSRQVSVERSDAKTSLGARPNENIEIETAGKMLTTNAGLLGRNTSSSTLTKDDTNKSTDVCTKLNVPSSFYLNRVSDDLQFSLMVKLNSDEASLNGTRVSDDLQFSSMVKLNSDEASLNGNTSRESRIKNKEQTFTTKARCNVGELDSSVQKRTAFQIPSSDEDSYSSALFFSKLKYLNKSTETMSFNQNQPIHNTQISHSVQKNHPRNDNLIKLNANNLEFVTEKNSRFHQEHFQSNSSRSMMALPIDEFKTVSQSKLKFLFSVDDVGWDHSNTQKVPKPPRTLENNALHRSLSNLQSIEHRADVERPGDVGDRNSLPCSPPCLTRVSFAKQGD